MLNDDYCKLLEATPARNPAALLGLHQSFVSSVKYPHSCGSFGFHSLPPFPRPYTTTYLLVDDLSRGLTDSEITSFLPAVLTGFDTVSFHSVGFEVSFDAVLTSATYRLAPWLLAPRR